LEGVQHIHGVGQACDINHSVRSSVAPDAKFFDAFADARHRFEIVRLQASLQTVDLESGVATGVIWKPSKYLQRVAEKRNGLHGRIVYQNGYKSRGI